MSDSSLRSIVCLGLALSGGCLAAEPDADLNPDTPPAQSSEAITARATATATLTDDAYVASQYADDTHGSDAYLVIGTAASNLHHIYLKLAVSGIPSGSTGISARLQVTPQTSATTPIAAHCGSSNAWTAAALTWNNQPGFAAATVASVAAETANTPAAFDVSACVTGNGTFTVVLDAPTGAVVKLDSARAPSGAPTIAVSYTPPASCTGADALLVPCPGKRWEGANPTLNGIDVADLQSFESMQGAQLGVVHFFRTPGSDLWGPAGGFQEQVYLNTAAPAADPRHLYIGYRPNADWTLFDGAGTDDAATIARIHSDAQRTAALFKQTHRKLWINAVNHEAERYVTGCGGGNADNPHNTVAAYHAAWRNLVAIFDAEFAAAGLSASHGDANYPVVWAINTQNLSKATNPATCKDAQGNGVSTFRGVMLALAPRTTSGALIVQWFGWNPYTHGGGGSLAGVIDDGYNYLMANAPADLKALPWHFGEFGYLSVSGPPSVAEGTSDFTTLASRLDAGSWPNVRMLLYFDDVAVQDPATVGYGPAFRTYATSSTMVR
ncbi:MAG TPA: DNRLRE domain-containing protein [Kofleriaceae bacterium]